MAEAGQGRHVEVQRHVVGNGALIAPLPVSGEGQEAIENTGFLAGSWLREALIEGRQNSFSRMMRTSSGFTGSSSFACISFPSRRTFILFVEPARVGPPANANACRKLCPGT